MANLKRRLDDIARKKGVGARLIVVARGPIDEGALPGGTLVIYRNTRRLS